MTKKIKKIKKICGNCRLYESSEQRCKITVLHDGERYNMPVSPEDKCHMEELGIEIQQVRWWTEDAETGEKTNNNGVVKMEYPKGFFGEEKNE